MKDQKQCGAGWAFAAVGAIESKLAIEGSHTQTLSEQQLLDCDVNGLNAGCNGGYASEGMKYFTDRYLFTDSAYKYTGQTGSCLYNVEDSSEVKLQSYKRIDGRDVNTVKLAVSEQPVTAAIAARNLAFQNYSGGIFDDDSCAEGDSTHEVLIVGYGKEGDTEYWLIKNSWGPEWGDQGYMKLKILTEDTSKLKSSI